MKSFSTMVAEIEAVRGEDVFRSGPATDGHIKKLEQAIGRKVPPSLKAFLMEIGYLEIHDTCICGINADGELAMIDETERLRDEFDSEVPDGLLAICPHDDGAYCIDLDQEGVDGECPIITFEGREPTPGQVAAPSFADWFVRFVYDQYVIPD